MCREADGPLLGKLYVRNLIRLLPASEALESQGSALWLPIPGQSDRHAEQVKQIMPLSA